MLEVLVLAGFAGVALWFLDRKDARHRLERQELYQRIQAPEIAVSEAASRSDAVELPAVRLDSDEDYWDAQREALARLERLEREMS